MKLIKKNLFSIIMVIGLSSLSTAQAALYPRGTEMIYDDVLGITWLKDANYAQTSGYDTDGRMTWNAANSWAASLSVGGYTDWRLPDVKPVNGIAFDFGIDYGFSINSTQSEMGYMYHENLGNLSQYDSDGNFTGGLYLIDWGLANTRPFDNLENYYYWSSVDLPQYPIYAWSFANNGFQGPDEKDREFYAWAVRSGDVTTVPLPASLWLMSSGLLGLMGLSRKR